MISAFSQRTIEALAYYVYALVDPRDNRIFYIGKGSGNRVFQHAKDSLNENDQSLKLDIIRDILREGEQVGLYILRHNLTEESAYVVESVLIDLMTYSKFNTTNLLTNVVAGHHQWDEGIKDVNEIDAIYNCSKIDMNHGDTLLLVSLNKSFNQAKANGVYRRMNIYDATVDGTRFKRDRCIFEGKLLNDSIYLNKDVSDYPFGSGGAIKYIRE